MDKNDLCEILPIIEKAAPFIGSLIHANKLGVIVGLLGMLVNCNPTDEHHLISKLKDDPDIYAKLKNLEITHSGWLKQVQL